VEGNRFEESAGGQRAIAVPRGQVVTGPLESPSTTPSAGSGTSVGSQPDGKSNAEVANELKVKFGLDAQALIDAGSDPKAILDLLNGAPSAANLLGLRPLASLSNTVGSRAWQEQASDSELAANGYVRGADGKVSMTPEKVDEVRRALIDDPKFRVGVMGVLALPGQVSRGLVKSDEIADLVDQASLVVGSILAAGVKAEPINVVGARTGPRTPIPPKSDAPTTRSLIRENQSADILSTNGFLVEQNPVVAGSKNPDYLINNQIFDNYAPSTGNVRNMASEIGQKVSKGQTDNVVINLLDSSATAAKVRAQLINYPILGLKEVIIIDRSGNITVITFKGK
jgi:hypothetical protein